VGREDWRAALAEDVVDLLARLSAASAAVACVAADRELAESIAWPGMAVWEVASATIRPVFEAAALEGFDQAAIVASDAPDVPGMVLGKLLQPLESKAVAVAPGGPSGGALGVAARLPLASWVGDVSLDDATAQVLRRGAPSPGDVATTAAWRRLRGAAELASLDMGLEGWDNTRVLLGG
jgi:2-phospho-L-lactate guanylyltransferase (CobY/MobA/RfbA family)